jgi:hypothetical protein
VALHDINAAFTVLKLGRSQVSECTNYHHFCIDAILGNQGPLTEYEKSITRSWFTLGNIYCTTCRVKLWDRAFRIFYANQYCDLWLEENQLNRIEYDLLQTQLKKVTFRERMVKRVQMITN